MNDIAAVRQGVDRLLLGDLQPMLGLLADDVAFTVAVGGDAPEYLEQSGKQPVVDYFMGLGGLVTFWQMDYTARGDQLIAWGKESFTIERCEIEGGCEFAPGIRRVRRNDHPVPGAGGPALVHPGWWVPGRAVVP
jgi:hypothetical protein